MASTSFSPINRVAGLVSGLETQKIVEDLMKAARIPLDNLLQQKQILQWRQEDYRVINRALMDFRTNTASPLRLQGTFQVKKATSSDETAVTAVPGGNAVTGTYEIQVTKLAQVGSLMSETSIGDTSFDPDAPIAQSLGWANDTTFTIDTYKADGSKDVTITIEVKSSESLNQLLAKIGAQTSNRLVAFFDADSRKVVISTTKTGNYNENKFTIHDSTDNFLATKLEFPPFNFDSNGDTINDSWSLTGTDAELTINGLATTKDENIFIMNNVTFTLKKTTASPVLVTVANDTDKIFETVKSFVDQFNSLLDTINKELTEERYPDYLPLTDAQKEQLTDKQIEQWEEKARSGLLKGDPLLQNIVYRLRRALTTPVTGLTVYDSLFDIGIRTGYYWEGGKLYVDEAKLREAINANPEAVMNLFTTSAPNFEQQGLGVRLYNEVNNAISRVTAQAGSPYTLVDNSFLSRSIRELDERIETMEERLARLEDRYWRQFTALEQALATMQAQSNWLAGMAAQIGSAK